MDSIFDMLPPSLRETLGTQRELTEEKKLLYKKMCEMEERKANLPEPELTKFKRAEPTIPEIVDDHFDEMLDDENEELDKAAKRYATEGDEISGLYVIEPEVDAFKAGAKWQRKQIREELFTMLNTSIDNEQFFEQLDEFIDELEKEDSV